MAESFMDKNGRNVEVHSANHTVAAADGGIVQLIDTDGTTQTLPAVAAGLHFTFQVAKSGVGVIISPAAGDGIFGGGFAGTDGLDVVLTAANARAGDFITVVGGDAAGYHVMELSGAWANA